MRLRSIGARLTLWYSGILGVTLLLVGIAAYGLLTYSLSYDVDVALQGVAQVITSQVHSEGRTFPPPDVDERFPALFRLCSFSPLL